MPKNLIPFGIQLVFTLIKFVAFTEDLKRPFERGIDQSDQAGSFLQMALTVDCRHRPSHARLHILLINLSMTFRADLRADIFDSSGRIPKDRRFFSLFSRRLAWLLRGIGRDFSAPKPDEGGKADNQDGQMTRH